MLGAWCASTARAARGRAVCVTPLGASAWPCAERVGGGGGALTRARGHPVGGGARARTRVHTAHNNTLCQVVPHAALVLCCGRCLPGHSGRRDDVPPGLGVTACTSTRWTRARRWQRCCGAAPLPVAPLDPTTSIAVVPCHPCPGATPPPHTDPKGDLGPSPSPQPRRRPNRAGRART